MPPLELDCRHLEKVKDLAAVCFPKTWGANDFAYFLGHECRLTFGLFTPDRALKAFFLGLLVQAELDVVSVAVCPTLRRQGLAETLIRHALEQPAVERAFLEVDIANAAAIALYRKAGFSVLQTRKGYYENQRDAYLMRWVRGPYPNPPA